MPERGGLAAGIFVHLDGLDGWRDRVAASGHLILEPLQERPWGLRDFRISDPDGYYLRVTSRTSATRLSIGKISSALIKLAPRARR